MEYYGIFYAIIPVFTIIKNNEAIFHIINPAATGFNI
jgi:hypothetical protein